MALFYVCLCFKIVGNGNFSVAIFSNLKKTMKGHLLRHMNPKYNRFLLPLFTAQSQNKIIPNKISGVPIRTNLSFVIFEYILFKQLSTFLLGLRIKFTFTSGITEDTLIVEMSNWCSAVGTVNISKLIVIPVHSLIS